MGSERRTGQKDTQAAQPAQDPQRTTTERGPFGNHTDSALRPRSLAVADDVDLDAIT